MPSLARSRWLVVALVPLACAVATEPELTEDQGSPSAGAGSASGSSSAGAPSFGATSTTGGTMAKAGTSGRGGTSSTAGQASAGGTASAGGGSGGRAGAGTGGGGQAGSAGAGGDSSGCGGLKTWKGGDSTLRIAEGEVIQWMGKRYKATATIAYPNAECAPDQPVDWCASWFVPDGDC